MKKFYISNIKEPSASNSDPAVLVYPCHTPENPCSLFTFTSTEPLSKVAPLTVTDEKEQFSAYMVCQTENLYTGVVEYAQLALCSINMMPELLKEAFDYQRKYQTQIKIFQEDGSPAPDSLVNLLKELTDLRESYGQNLPDVRMGIFKDDRMIAFTSLAKLTGQRLRELVSYGYGLRAVKVPD